MIQDTEFRTLAQLIDALSGEPAAAAVLALRKKGHDAWSRQRLGGGAARLARGLLAEGIGPPAPVVVLADARPEWMLACLAVIRCGAVVVPLDVQLPDEALSYILRDSDARVVFTTSDQLKRIDGLEKRHDVRCILLDAGEDDPRGWRALLRDEGELPPCGQGDTAALFYTSGTTGQNKGVPLTHGNIIFQLHALLKMRIIGEHDRILLPLPLHHVYPFVMGFLYPLAARTPIVLPFSLTGPQVVRALLEGEVSAVIGVPRLYRALWTGIEGQLDALPWPARPLLRALVWLSYRLRRHLHVYAGRLLLFPVHKRIGPRRRAARPRAGLAAGRSRLEDCHGLRPYGDEPAALHLRPRGGARPQRGLRRPRRRPAYR